MTCIPFNSCGYRRCITDRPATEGCEADRNRYELKAASPIQTDQNDYNLIQIDCNDRNTRETPRTDPPKKPEPPPSPEPIERRNYPVLRTVKAIIAGDGAVPEKPVRPVSRQNSDVPLVKFETPIFRDRWKDGSQSYGAATNNRTSGHPSTTIEPNWRYPDQSEKLTTLNEVTEKPNKKATKLDFLPSRLFATPSILSSPAGKKSKGRRPDSSTPLFDGDSLSSTEAWRKLVSCAKRNFDIHWCRFLRSSFVMGSYLFIIPHNNRTAEKSTPVVIFILL